MMVPAKLLSSTSTQQAGPKQTAVATKIPEEPTTEEPINLRNLLDNMIAWGLRILHNPQ